MAKFKIGDPFYYVEYEKVRQGKVETITESANGFYINEEYSVEEVYKKRQDAVEARVEEIIKEAEQEISNLRSSNESQKSLTEKDKTRLAVITDS